MQLNLYKATNMLEEANFIRGFEYAVNSIEKIEEEFEDEIHTTRGEDSPAKEVRTV